MTVHIIAGPTASGKSSYAMEKAKELNGVIINADSMQIYNSLHRLTAQPDSKDIESIPHRLYSYLEPNEKCSAKTWSDLAIIEIEKAFNEDKTPIIVGGTGLYIKSLTEGFSPIPAIDQKIKASSILKQQELGNPAFHAVLKKIDPVMAQKLHPNDSQRLIRAYEVILSTNRSLAEWQKEPNKINHNYNFDITIFKLPREILRQRCNQRFDIMMEQNILDEVIKLNQQISNNIIDKNVPITNALGFHPLQKHLNGELTIEEAIEQSKTETKQYAKRQDTWFKNQISKDPSNIISLSYIN